MTCLFFLFLFFYHPTYCSIALKVKTLPEDNYIYNKTKTNSDYLFYKSQLYKRLYTFLEIGNPTQIVPIFIKINEIIFEITSINPSNINYSSISKYVKSIYNITSLLKSNSLYNETNSNFYHLEKCIENIAIFKDCDEYCISNDLFIFTDKITSIKKILSFTLVKGELGSKPGTIGLGFVKDIYISSTDKCFLKELKNAGVINKYEWYFNFNNWDNSEGELFIGSTPHQDFPDIYSEKDLEYTKMVYKDPELSQPIEIKFNKIYIGNNNSISFKNTNAEFLFDSDVIITSKIFFLNMSSLFLYEFINEGICFTSKFSQNYLYSFELEYFYCFANISKILYELIPSIKFFSNDLNYTFELSKNELFAIKGNYIYSRILFTDSLVTKWYLGRQFTMKYPFVFYPQNKMIGFYKKFKKKVTSNNFPQIILEYSIIVPTTLFIGVFLIFIGMKIQKIKSHKKKRANELIDDYDYSTENVIDDDKENRKNEKKNRAKNYIEKTIN